MANEKPCFCGGPPKQKWLNGTREADVAALAGLRLLGWNGKTKKTPKEEKVQEAPTEKDLIVAAWLRWNY